MSDCPFRFRDGSPCRLSAGHDAASWHNAGPPTRPQPFDPRDADPLWYGLRNLIAASRDSNGTCRFCRVPASTMHEPDCPVEAAVRVLEPGYAAVFDPDPLTVEEHVDDIMRRYGRALDELGNDEPRPRRLGCSVIPWLLAALFWLVAYGVTRL